LSLHRPFAPHPWTVGGHRQTLLGYWSRRFLAWTVPTEDRIVESAGGARLLVRASWHEGPRESRPALLVIHGLGGSDRATYAVATGRHAWSLGWHVARMNMRGAGDSEELCPLLYNAGLDCDVLAVLEDLAREVPRIAIVGFSLGASLSLLALARNAGRVPAAVRSLVAISPPLDLAACADALERPANRLYQRYFMGNLRDAYRRLQRRRPDLYEAARERGTRTIREYDEAITAPYGGFASADQYYSASSAGPVLARVGRPALLLSAGDDPMVPSDSVARWPLPESGRVARETLHTGGHVGFTAATSAPGRFWAAERAMAFLTEHATDEADATDPAPSRGPRK
jgi:uncharacterized protein